MDFFSTATKTSNRDFRNNRGVYANVGGNGARSLPLCIDFHTQTLNKSKHEQVTEITRFKVINILLRQNNLNYDI
jgi:hypothetical protein